MEGGGVIGVITSSALEPCRLCLSRVLIPSDGIRISDAPAMSPVDARVAACNDFLRERCRELCFEVVEVRRHGSPRVRTRAWVAW